MDSKQNVTFACQNCGTKRVSLHLINAVARLFEGYFLLSFTNFNEIDPFLF